MLNGPQAHIYNMSIQSVFNKISRQQTKLSRSRKMDLNIAGNMMSEAERVNALYHQLVKAQDLLLRYDGEYQELMRVVSSELNDADYVISESESASRQLEQFLAEFEEAIENLGMFASDNEDYRYALEQMENINDIRGNVQMIFNDLSKSFNL